MKMNYRVVVRFSRTEEIREQYFPTYGDADTIADYLIFALENGAELGYVLQERISGKVITAQKYGKPVGQWENLSWNA